MNEHCDYCRGFQWCDNQGNCFEPVYGGLGYHHPACPVVAGNGTRVGVGPHGGGGHHGGHHGGHGGGFGGVVFVQPEIAYCPNGWYLDAGNCHPYNAIIGQDAPATSEPAGFHDPLLGDVPFPTPGSGYEAGQQLGKKIPTPGQAYDLGKKIPGAAGGLADKATGAADKFGNDLKTIAWIGGIAAIAIAGIFAYTAYKTDMPRMAFGALKEEKARTMSNVDTTARLLAKGG